MVPVIVLIGCGNVGKTTIFNKLIKFNNFFSNNYLKDKLKNYGLCDINNYFFLLVDTISINRNFNYNLEYELNLIISESDIILFITDINYNYFYIDLIISRFLKKINKYIFLIINKFDNNKLYFNIKKFFILGFGKPYLISAVHNYNLNNSIFNILKLYCLNKNCFIKKNNFKNILINLIGDKKSGKTLFISSLIKKKFFFCNLLFFYLKYKNIYYMLLNFLNLNKKNNFIFILKSLIISNIILYIINPLNKIYNYKIINLIFNNFLNIIFIINKSDLLNLYEKIFFKNFIKNKLKIKNYYLFFFSSLFNYNLNYIKIFINKIYYFSVINFSTNFLNKIINNISKFLKLYYNYNIKINYIHQGGKNPVLIIIHYNKKNKIKNCYKKFLEKIFIKKLNFKNIPLKFKFKN